MSNTLAELGSRVVQRGMLSAEQVQQAERAARVSVRKHHRLRAVLADVLARQKRLTNYQQATLSRVGGYLLCVGPYVVFEPLGNGAMSCVYRARHRGTGEMVALKLVPKRLTGRPEVVQLWRREVEAALSIDHPNLVRAHHGRVDKPPLYLVMDMVEGPTVKYLLAHRGPFDVPTSLSLVHQVARGLDALGRRGVVHGDVKPGNVMVTWQGQVKLVDFGFSHDPARADAITRRGLVVGTANYLAPEASWRGHHSDIRADLYSLGVTLYEMLTGELPFAADTREEALQAHRHLDPRDPRDHVPHLPDEVVDVVLRLLERDPQQRYASPGELRQELAALRRGWPLRDGSHLSSAIAMEPSVSVEPIEGLIGPASQPRWGRRLADVVRAAVATVTRLGRAEPSDHVGRGAA